MTTTGARASQRRGRPPAGTSAAHREVVLDAVFELLVERGYQGTTMAAVAERAGSSKETLYAWFGGKQGLFTALIRRQAEAANQAVAAALDDDGGTDPAATLTAFATNLLRLLLGERSVALNRAALAELGGGRAAGRAWRRAGGRAPGPGAPPHRADRRGLPGPAGRDRRPRHRRPGRGLPAPLRPGGPGPPDPRAPGRAAARPPRPWPPRPGRRWNGSWPSPRPPELSLDKSGGVGDCVAIPSRGERDE